MIKNKYNAYAIHGHVRKPGQFSSNAFKLIDIAKGQIRIMNEIAD